MENNQKAKWIWLFGEFEHYHNLMVHNRREQYGYKKPSMWKLYSPETVVRFETVRETKGGEIRITALGNFVITVGEGFRTLKQYEGQSVIQLEPGKTKISVIVSNVNEFPCLYIEGALVTDEHWTADDMTADIRPVGSYDIFNSRDKSPELFPFSYRELPYVSREITNDGVLFDFGKETFARITVKLDKDKKVFVSYGESREEALDRKWSVIHLWGEIENGELVLEPRALRYLFIDDSDAEISAQYEYLPLEYRGSFKCNDEIINKVWDIAAYTFHLNSREFFLDGIKRDRWVWSADAYQSLFVNRYLFLDADIEKRTLIALGGKTPVKSHINTIMDYSFFYIISINEYYRTYGDKDFLKKIYPQMKAIMDFCRDRVSEDGFIRGMDKDWVFIDWAPMDKTGALCAEQILFARALSCYSWLCDIVGASDEGSHEQSRELQKQIINSFSDAGKGVFIDSYESGKKNITRHSNILAYLFLPITSEQKQSIYSSVIMNENVPQITTPYFKFYENQVHCIHGNLDVLEKAIRSYYGGMLELGATTLYEEYDPSLTGAQHYEMYGNPYEKSLCHAWSASPIYLLGAYRLGVKNTGIGYDSFEVCPNLGGLESMEGTVPTPRGEIRIKADKNKLSVIATAPGGVLITRNNKISLPACKEVILENWC